MASTGNPGLHAGTTSAAKPPGSSGTRNSMPSGSGNTDFPNATPPTFSAAGGGPTVPAAGPSNSNMSESARTILKPRGVSTRKPPASLRISAKEAISFGSSMVTLRVGEGDNLQTLTIHENILRTRSTLLQNTVNDAKDKDNEQKSFDFSKDDPQAFALYTQLIYSGRLPSKTEPHEASEEYTLLCKLYVLTQRINDIKASNAAMDAIFDRSREPTPDTSTLPGGEHVRLIYNGTSKPCAARRLLLHFYTYRATAKWMDEDLPLEFVNDLARSLLERRAFPAEDVTKICKSKDYHDQEVVEEVVDEAAGNAGAGNDVKE
ncbi:hypothetical protein BDV95DRAFT_112033 [Massariosphaeria phaeospora]|uniref:BTB domain-containing protein n=1 Tax=Massariosphaeria phaeospora TaxID=100035 RepID=A0A7C8I647_9PLEO|nr:hypothetical protein BDV95DRAFT_112033 [Massariosphaeria phaeospora]